MVEPNEHTYQLPLLSGMGRHWLYEPDFGNKVRYILGAIEEGDTAAPLFCVGINSSTAQPGNLDNTLKSVQRLAASNGFKSWVMLNVYAQRATDPNDLDQNINIIVHRKNLERIGHILKSYQSPVIWAAWGTLIDKRKYLRDCLKDIIAIAEFNDCRWVTIGKPSKKGHPHHPLYLRSNAKYETFSIKEYLSLIELESK